MKELVRRSSPHVVVVLHNIRSVYNVGSIFRTADAVGVTKIYLCGITPTPIDRLGHPRKDFTKVSLGAERTVSWEYARSTASVLKKLKKEGYVLCAIEQSRRSRPYYDPRRNMRVKKIALVLGNEIHGLPPSLLNLADETLEIPMHGSLIRHAHHPRRTGSGKESLNVAVAFGIVAYRLRHP